MARPISRGLNYTFLSKDFFNDRKVRRLKRLCGDDAPYAFVALLCLITGDGYYIKYDDNAIYDIADMTGIDEKKVSRIIDACGDVGLLDKKLMEEERVLTSHGIQRYYAETCAQLKRKTGVEEYSLLNRDTNERVSPEETHISPEETQVYSEETPSNKQNSEFLPKNLEEIPTNREEGKRIEKNRREENRKDISFSSVPSSSCGEELTPEEEKEKFVSFFTFCQNYVAPNYEYERMVAYNNSPSAKKKWAQLTATEKQSCLVLWHPEKESVQEHKKRFSDKFLQVWQAVYRQLQTMGAPYAVRMAALDDGIRWDYEYGKFTLFCPEILYSYIEVPPDENTPSRISQIKPILWPFMKTLGCHELLYRVIKEL